jgi:hypothetical protein
MHRLLVGLVRPKGYDWKSDEEEEELKFEKMQLN